MLTVMGKAHPDIAEFNIEAISQRFHAEIINMPFAETGKGEIGTKTSLTKGGEEANVDDTAHLEGIQHRKEGMS